MSLNSYGVYIVHLAVLGGIALAMLDTDIPSVWKYLTLTVSSYVASNLLVSGYRAVVRRRLVT